jgi:hypothetical protein
MKHRILGALDESDLQCIIALVDDFQYVDMRRARNSWYNEDIDEIIKFVDNLRDANKLP